ncbi:hypothetical protein OPT61_g2422 [Boeremia exigua]|uniref:Uncharacterized protein n=1 Tax=Boeremia exigua TaxID=749465 RepID=A0ACC2ILJ6_9PLEO|nr:hypothetical protein OPT61_g2422 [Boeremia exigua]
MNSPKPATDTIIEQQKQVRDSLPFSDKSDFDNAQYGLLGRREPNAVTNAEGVTVWDNDEYKFLKEREDAPPEANPSLWRQSNLNSFDGLFKVVEGREGLVVIDPLTSAETGEAAYQLYKQYRGERPVKAIIYTHSHIDHFGGVKGFVSQSDVDSGAVRIFAPEGFLEHAVSENVYVGTAMARRAAYMYGAALDRGPQGQVGAGLGQTVSTGTITLIKPTDYISKTGHTESVDGVKMVFQMAPDTEAPAEMLIYFPDFEALCAAEDATHTFHNVLTLRGAVARDPHIWAHTLTDTIDMFGGSAKVLFASHHWPTWGYDEVVNFLTLQRDLYAYVHDQTLRLINQGLNGPEIAEQMTLPPALDQAWNGCGYYGSINHNVKAIYQRYIGWFDGNPAHLWEHISVERAKRYVDLAGGMLKLIEAGRSALKDGDLRWAAEVLNHAVFASPSNRIARTLLADVYEQLGYGAENGPWRNFFISGTTELRTSNFGTPTQTASADIIAQLTPEMLFDSFAIQINGPKAWNEQLAIKVVLTDGPCYRWWLSNGALVYTQADESANADVTLTTTTGKLPAIVNDFDPQTLAEAGIDVQGDTTALDRLAALLDKGDPAFNIIEP